MHLKEGVQFLKTLCFPSATYVVALHDLQQEDLIFSHDVVLKELIIFVLATLF